MPAASLAIMPLRSACGASRKSIHRVASSSSVSCIAAATAARRCAACTLLFISLDDASVPVLICPIPPASATCAAAAAACFACERFVSDFVLQSNGKHTNKYHFDFVLRRLILVFAAEPWTLRILAQRRPIVQKCTQTRRWIKWQSINGVKSVQSQIYLEDEIEKKKPRH